MSEAVVTQAPAATETAAVKGMKKNGMRHLLEPRHHDLTIFAGKQWHDNKTAFRPRANQSSWEKRTVERKALAAVKAKEKELKDEKESERQVSYNTG
jgi:rRNA-processing protein CGR1